MKDIIGTISFIFINRFTKAEILNIVVPYQPFLAINGHYSKLYKRMKQAAAVGMEIALVKGRFYKEPKLTYRAVISFQSGASINFPYDVNKQDVKIILHHLEGVKMTL